jgi:hypothetical protein
MWKYESYTDNVSAYPYALITDRGKNTVTKQEIDDNYPLFVRNNDVVRYPQPRLTSMDFKLTKEIGEFGKISFYVNNFLNYRPYYERTNATSLTRQNTEINFGAEITYLF